MPVKMLALDAATVVLIHDGLPAFHVADNFVNLLFDLVYYVLENLSDEGKGEEEEEMYAHIRLETQRKIREMEVVIEVVVVFYLCFC